MSGIFSVPFTGLATFANPKYGQPIWIGLAIIAVAITIYRVWATERKRVVVLQEKLRPKLKFSCGKNVAGCFIPTTVNHAILISNGTTQHIVPAPVKMNYFRVAVETDGATAVSGCCGTVKLIKKNDVVKMGGENLQLTFAPGSDSDATAKTIRDKDTAYLDVLTITEKNDIIITTKNFQYPNSIDFRSLFKEIGEYVLTIIVSGNDIVSSTVELNFNWTGDWQTAEVSCLAVNT